jgi:hypothetical protein
MLGTNGNGGSVVGWTCPYDLLDIRTVEIGTHNTIPRRFNPVNLFLGRINSNAAYYRMART